MNGVWINTESNVNFTLEEIYVYKTLTWMMGDWGEIFRYINKYIL